jgi:hypothetical protein
VTYYVDKDVFDGLEFLVADFAGVMDGNGFPVVDLTVVSLRLI